MAQQIRGGDADAGRQHAVCLQRLEGSAPGSLAAIGLSTQVQTICLSIVKSCVAFLASQNQLPAVHLLQVGLQSSPLHVVLVAELTKHVALGRRLVKHLDLRWISVGGAAIE